MKKHNFSAGPSILSKAVMKKASKSVIELNNIGLSILEISHRSSDFIEIMNQAKEITKQLLNIPDSHEVLFLQGGASLQFYMSALNFSRINGNAGYIDTGTWSQKAIKESQKIGKTTIIASSSDKKYNYIPKIIDTDKKLDYIHFTSNNTIYGTQFHSFKNILDKNTKIICDMSSDIFSKKIDVSDFDLIYAGAQKNMGPAGATLVILKKKSLNPKNNLPSYLDYNTHIAKDSMFNTPPVFSIYVSMLTLKWIKENGGIDFIQKNNEKKSKLLYEEIDRNPLFLGLANKDDRSNMNATFALKDNTLERKFEKMCFEAGINGIKGHRSVGGYRASMYNALQIESINKLIETMRKIEKK